MDFANPWLLLVFIPFLLLLFFLKKIEKKRYLDIPTSLIVRRIGLLKSFLKKSGRVIWISAVLLLVIALARPQGISDTQGLGVEGRIMVLSIDLSMSMSGISRSTTGRPAIDVIKELSLEFVKKRATTDLVGVTAYGGSGMGRNMGEAAIIVFPTSEYAQLEASILLLEPPMLGVCTSIGEGLFLSILSLLDPSTVKDIDTPLLLKSMESQDKTYALNLVKKLGRFRNKMIVLFTDGKNNTGIEPTYPLWLAQMLGIKVYFAALQSTGTTGLSPEEEIRQKNLLIRGVLEAGGKYFEMDSAEQVREFYEEVDRLETAHLEITPGLEKKSDLCYWPVLMGFILVCIVVTLENIFPRIQ